MESRGIMKIRIEGKPDEVAAAVEKIKEVFQVDTVSKPYKNRNSDDIRIYVNLKN